MKFVSARASLRGKSVRTIRGRTIKVDLRGKSVGRYRVFITAKYKAHGKVYKVRSTRPEPEPHARRSPGAVRAPSRPRRLIVSRRCSGLAWTTPHEAAVDEDPHAADVGPAQP